MSKHAKRRANKKAKQAAAAEEGGEQGPPVSTNAVTDMLHGQD